MEGGEGVCWMPWRWGERYHSQSHTVQTLSESPPRAFPGMLLVDVGKKNKILAFGNFYCKKESATHQFLFLMFFSVSFIFCILYIYFYFFQDL